MSNWSHGSLTRPNATPYNPMYREIEVPPKVTPADDSGYFEELTKAIFRSGFSWRVVRNKWANFRLGFDDFHIFKVASYGIEEMERLFQDEGIVRNRRKIIATVENARKCRVIVADHGSFYSYLRSMDEMDYRAKVKALTKDFWGLGNTGAFVFLHCVNEETPTWEER